MEILKVNNVKHEIINQISGDKNRTDIDIEIKIEIEIDRDRDRDKDIDININIKQYFLLPDIQVTFNVLVF